jgi:hypothetical protein
MDINPAWKSTMTITEFRFRAWLPGFLICVYRLIYVVAVIAVFFAQA